MFIKCQQCNKDIEQNKNGTRKFCDGKCKMDFIRNKPSVTSTVTTSSVTTVTKSGLKEITVTLEEVCTPDKLRMYPNMCETKKEQKESIYRLENNDLEDLIKEGVSIPAWRRKGTKYPQ